jgi:hypothetical protein
MLGMGSALENICGQVFGAGQVDMLVLLQRTCMDHLMDDHSRTPLARLHICYSNPKLLGQEDTIADLAGENPLFW